MAYVLSDYKTSRSSCTGQHFFKFDPTIFSTNPVWIQKTKTSASGDDCGHLGLSFGRNESLLYAFSWFNGFSTITLIDTNGSSKWQYTTPNGHNTDSNLI